GARRFAYRGVEMDPFIAPERVTVAEAFEAYGEVDLLASIGPDGVTARHALPRAAEAAGVRVAPDDTWSDIFSRVLVERVEPYLGIGRPCIFYEYPVAEAALARSS